jgi:hypothetical protein
VAVAGLEFVRKKLREYVRVDEVMMVHSLLRLLTSLMASDFEEEKNAKVRVCRLAATWVGCNVG